MVEKEKLGEKSSLRVNRAEYLERARLRAQRCPLFARVEISEEVVAAHLPEEGVPNGIQRGSIEMATLEHFAPNLSGPATRGQPFRREEEEGGEGDAAEAEEVEEGQDTVTEDAGCCRAPDALIADENANAEFLIGLDGSPDDDAVGKLASFRAKVALAEEAGKRWRAPRFKSSERGKTLEMHSRTLMRQWRWLLIRRLAQQSIGVCALISVRWRARWALSSMMRLSGA